MRIEKQILIAICALAANIAGAQETDFSQYYLNLPAVNSGFTGIEDYWDLKTGLRQGWNDFAIDNHTVFLSAYGNLNYAYDAASRNNALRTSNPLAYKQSQSSKEWRKKRRKHGVGGMITNSTIGTYHALDLNVNYAYHLPVSPKLNWSLGTSIGLTNKRVNVSEYSVRDEVNDLFYQQLIQSNPGSMNSFTVDLGSVLYSDNFYVGVSSHGVSRKQLTGDELFFDDAVQYIGQSAGNIRLNENLVLNMGGLMMYRVGYDLDWSVNARVRYKDIFYTGIAYQNKVKDTFFLGALLNDTFSINYAYDHYISQLSNFNVHTHEFVLGISLFNRYDIKTKKW